MNTLNPTALPRRQAADRRPGWRPGAWACSLVLVWLALLVVPVVALFGAGDQPTTAGAADAPPKPWMPIYPTII